MHGDEPGDRSGRERATDGGAGDPIDRGSNDARGRDPIGPVHEAPTALVESDDARRSRAVLAVAPLLAIGLFDLALLLGWGVDPLWGFLILPPILFVCALAWLAFSTDFARDRTGD